MRTVAEIEAYVKDVIDSRDPMGLAISSLAVYLPAAEAAQKAVPTDDEIKKEIVGYLSFAFGKAIDHRGLSANRSVNHLANWAWLLGRDDLASFAADDGNYPSYGVPVLKRFAREFGVALPAEIERWNDGSSCEPGCERGC